MYSPPHKVARRKQQGRTTPPLPPVLSHVMTTTAATIVLVAVLVSCTVKARAQDAYGFFPSTGSGMCPAILNSPLPLLLQQQQQQLRNDSATSSHDGIKPSSDSRKDGPQGMQPCTDMLVGDYTCSDLGTFVDGNPDYDVSTTPYGNFWEGALAREVCCKTFGTCKELAQGGGCYYDEELSTNVPQYREAPMCSCGFVFDPQAVEVCRWASCQACTYYSAPIDELLSNTDSAFIAMVICNEATKGEVSQTHVHISESICSSMGIYEPHSAHPVTYTPEEIAQALYESYQDELLSQIVLERGISGRAIAEMTFDQMVSAGVSFDTAARLIVDRDVLLSPSAPNTATARRPYSALQTYIVINKIWELSEVDFTYNAEVIISMYWEDPKIWADCAGDKYNPLKGICSYLWIPQLTYNNCLEDCETPQEYEVWSNSMTKTGFYTETIRGKFFSPLSFKRFPVDKQRLQIDILIYNAMYAQLRPSPLFVTFSDDLKTLSSDYIPGWTANGVTARDEVHTTLNFGYASQGAWGLFISALKKYGTDIENLNSKPMILLEIEVSRQTFYYTMNYVLIVFLLTALSWVTFFLDYDALDTRVEISLTIILALNVYQIILGTEMPKTGYLTPMHSLIIASTFFVVLSVMEAIFLSYLMKTYGSADDDGEPPNLLVSRKATMDGAKDATAFDLSDGIEDEIKWFKRCCGRSAAATARLLIKYMDVASLIIFPILYTVTTVLLFLE